MAGNRRHAGGTGDPHRGPDVELRLDHVSIEVRDFAGAVGRLDEQLGLEVPVSPQAPERHDRARYKIVASSMRQCMSGDGDSPLTQEQLEKMFLTLARRAGRPGRTAGGPPAGKEKGRNGLRHYHPHTNPVR